jgi:hypothetical protein
VGGVCRTDRGLHRVPEAGGDEYIRRRLSWILGTSIPFPSKWC